ncbi:hypothetical protein DCM91_16235 [Chitinophaga costaii]|uniref:hypothetical protein n=1 Tax=Chitinophaga costaii TaxID=1335309 RepID=UPI000B7E9B67|nr:hypothetical protein [Chitinophaga costaii]PUZ21583.1 hypothetical protein DCM91_16235 [Chitinophaga costaii]
MVEEWKIYVDTEIPIVLPFVGYALRYEPFDNRLIIAFNEPTEPVAFAQLVGWQLKSVGEEEND